MRLLRTSVVAADGNRHTLLAGIHRPANVLYAAHPEAGNPVDLFDWNGWNRPAIRRRVAGQRKAGTKRPSKTRPPLT